MRALEEREYISQKKMYYASFMSNISNFKNIPLCDPINLVERRVTWRTCHSLLRGGGGASGCEGIVSRVGIHVRIVFVVAILVRCISVTLPGNTFTILDVDVMTA